MYMTHDCEVYVIILYVTLNELTIKWTTVMKGTDALLEIVVWIPLNQKQTCGNIFFVKRHML